MSVTGYLLERGLLQPSAVVHGGLTVDDCSQLNRVFLVTADGARHLLVKVGPRAAREAAVLARLSAIPSLTHAVPRVVDHDPAEHALVLEAVPGARDLLVHHARGRLSRSLAAEAGRSLARLHAVSPAALADVTANVPAAPPHRPDLDTLRRLSAAAIELTRIVQGSDELCADLDELLAGRPPAAAVIHGDVRWGNCMALRGPSRRWSALQLVDWELCDVGDPAVDVGAFVGEYLRSWIRSMPVADPRDPGALRARARIPLRRVRPAVQAFWSAYSEHRRRRGDEGELLRRSLRFAALRLLESAFEEAQARDELRPGMLAPLPLSRNVLRRPDLAAELLELT